MSIDYTDSKKRGTEQDDEVLLTTSRLREDDGEGKLRPQTLSDYTGQEKAKKNLAVFIEGAKRRKEPLDHVLLHGPPGLGKTTLAAIIANEMGVTLRKTSGPAIEKPKDLAALLTNLGENDILFIDEIHRMNRAIEEILYPAMEDKQLDIIIGQGPAATSICLELKNFTLIGRHDAVRTALLTAARPVRHRPEAGACTRPGADKPLSSGRPDCWVSRPYRRARRKSPPAAAARPELPTGCSGASATSPRSIGDGVITREVADGALLQSGNRPYGPGRHRQAPSGEHHPQVLRRRTGRPGDNRGHHQRGANHAGGRL